MKSILFVLGRWGCGGVERVTAVLAAAFVARGFDVSIVAFEIGDRMLLNGLDNRIKIGELGGKWFGGENQNRLAELIKLRKVDIVINQWCVPYKVTRFLRGAMRGTNAKLVSVHHNQPDRNKRISDAKGWLSKLIWTAITRINLRLVYDRSDAYILLSDSFIDLFKNFVCLRNPDKLHVITNPLTLDIATSTNKENVIVYVGRLEETQKRVSRVVEVWKKLVRRLPDWRLEIVGDGPDRASYEHQACGISNIEFKGFQDPSQYYAKGKILLLTSDFEGFGLVLVEAMAYGCVPIVYASYPAAKDIVRFGENLIFPPFDVNKFTDKVFDLAKNNEEWKNKSNCVRTIAKDFSIDSIVKQWEALFTRL